MNTIIFAADTAFGLIGVILFIVATISIYFMLTIFARVNNHHNLPAIFILNLMLGWTFIGWVIALVWAITRK